MADNKDKEKKKKKKNKSVSKEIEGLKPVDFINPHMKEQKVINALTADNASTEASRQLIFKPVREMLEAHGAGNELRGNLEDIW